MINVKDLKKEFINDGVTTKILQGLTFEIKEGELTAITGVSGSGKSTLMYILGFLSRPTSGTYHFLEKEVSEFDDNQLADLRNKKIGFVFQSFNLLPKTSVLDNVKLPLQYTKVVDKDARAKKVIESVGLGHRLFHLSNQLSGGEQQRVAIARALVNNPSVIFADEPTGNLDSKSGDQVMDILEGLNKEGKTIILVTHEKEIYERARRIIYLKDGKIVGDTNSK